MTTLNIDRTRCQGHGRCALIDNDVFDVSDEGLGIVLEPNPGPSRADGVRMAIDNCPEEAISWTEG